jgi:regulator of replication initiation timing
MQTELQQVLESISDLKTEFKDLKTEVKDLKTEFSDLKAEVKADIKEAKIDAKLFDTKFNYYQQATQWVIVLSFTLILAATAITIFSSVFAFR